jgi:hypothetical protein
MGIAPLHSSSPATVFEFLDDRGTPRGRPHWAWKYQLGGNGGARAFYHEADGRIGGFIGMLPTTLHHGDAQARAAWFVDWATAPGEGSVGVGVGLLRKAQAATDVLLTLEGSADTRQILPRLKWTSAAPAATWILPLTARAIADRRPFHGRRWLRAPALLTGKVLALYFRVGKPADIGLTLREVDRFPASYDAVWEQRRHEFAPVMERSSAQLNFMCAEFPEGGYRRYLICDGERMTGHLVLRGDDKDGLRRGRIIDALWERKRTRVAEWLVRQASRILQDAGADYIECTASVRDLEDALAACRFRRRREVPVWYHRLPDGTPPPDSWYITYLDCDRAYR